MKTDRRLAREFALQALFHREANQSTEIDQAFADFWSMFQRCHEDGIALFKGEEGEGIEFGLPDKPRERVRAYAEELVCGTLRNLSALDHLIEASADNWRLDRMSSVDRNILRLAVFETRFSDEPTPPAVVIDEAVELAKLFGTEESGRFVNGILDSVFHKDLKSAGRKAAPVEDETD